MIMGADDPKAVEQTKTYVIELIDPEDGQRKQFTNETTWRKARALVNEVCERYGVTTIRLGVVEGDVVRELMRK